MTHLRILCPILLFDRQPGVRKTSLVLCDHVQKLLEASSGNVLVVTPTTVARAQAARALLACGCGPRLRILGSQKLCEEEKPLTLSHLLINELLPSALQVDAASSYLLQQVRAWKIGDAHTIPAAHEAVVVARESVEHERAKVQADIIKTRRACVTTLGCLLRPDAVRMHAVLDNVHLVAIDEAGVVAAAELALLLCHVGNRLDAGCRILLLGDPCQDNGRSSARGWAGSETFLRTTLEMSLLQYLFHRLRTEPGETLREMVRFLNQEMPSVRVPPRVADVLNRLMYDHILIQMPWCADAPASGVWRRQSPIVRVDGEPLFPPLRSARGNDAGQIQWVVTPHLTSCQESQPHHCPVAAFVCAALACRCSAAAADGTRVVILCRYRAQCELNHRAVQYFMRLDQFQQLKARIDVATSLGYQGCTAEQVILCLPMNMGLWNSFHLEPRALFNMLGRTQQTLLMPRFHGALTCSLPGRAQIAGLLQWYEPDDAWLSLDDMTRYFPGWEEHSLALGPVLEPADLSSDDDATSSSSDDDVGISNCMVPNHFEMFLAAIGHVQPPRLLALHTSQKMRRMERLVRTWPSNLDRIVKQYLDRNPPIHLGPVTSPSAETRYCYFVLEDWTLGSRIQADVLAYALLAQLTTSAAVQQAIAEAIEPGMLLSVGWCTHKYKHTEDGERQQAKGSGKRTHFYLLACREHAETSAGQELQPSLCLGHAYHTTMWFEGTYTPRGSSCLSSRLLVTWNQRVPNVFLEHLEDAWRQLPSCVQ